MKEILCTIPVIILYVVMVYYIIRSFTEERMK